MRNEGLMAGFARTHFEIPVIAREPTRVLSDRGNPAKRTAVCSVANNVIYDKKIAAACRKTPVTYGTYRLRASQ